MWIKRMTKRDLSRMAWVHRRVVLQVAQGYRTVFYPTSAVVASMPPIHFLVKERAERSWAVQK